MKELDLESRPTEEEIVVLKRQRKMVEEDIEDEMPQRQDLEAAYASVLSAKVISATAKQSKSDFDQSEFKKDVVKYCGARKMDETDGKRPLTYCHLSGWWDKNQVKAAHLVRKSLQSEELAYLFGVGEVVLLEARNGKCARSCVVCNEG